MQRRHFLMSAGAATIVPKVGWTSPSHDLIAQPVMAQILPEDSPATPMLGFNGGSPGPELRIRKSSLLDVRFLNQMDQGSAVHWHGIRSDNAMDGVPGLTQDVVPPGAEFAYQLRPPDAGT